MNKSLLIIFTAAMAVCTSSLASFLPDDFVPRRMKYAEEEKNDLTEQQFNDIIQKVETLYAPIVKGHGANLKVDRAWSDDTVNAYARQVGSTWEVKMFGGLARYKLMTGDGFAMVMCHELGHHLAGFPIRPALPLPIPIPIPGLNSWAANEGQSDYFAAHTCGPMIWEDEVDINATFRTDVNPLVQQNCDSIYSEEARQNLCYRVSAAGLSLSRTLADLSETPEPNYDTPNPDVVSSTNHKHPEAQCRLDTTLAGALCTVPFDNTLIPGKSVQGKEAEREAADTSCMRVDNHTEGARPLCWFKPGL